MAFLDNSGDIILDAVLTDVGRKRMAAGNFRIVKFALGDDEIDYGLYDKTNTNGPAYYDLQILQTPILEAFSQKNAAINYGLVSYARNDLLYLPTILQNTGSSLVSQGAIKLDPTYNVHYLADNTKFSGNDNTATLLKADITNGLDSILISNYGGSPRFILIETGLNTTELSSNSQNQNSYLLSVGLNDNRFSVECDKRFINAVWGPPAGASFGMDANNEGVLSLSTLTSNTTSTTSRDLQNYSKMFVAGVTSRLYPPAGNDNTSNYSAIAGPRGAWTAVSFGVNPSLTLSDYQRYGKTAQSQGASSATYDYIDTIVYVRGANTNVVLQLPIRIIRAAQTS
jgi:hypothetical protein